ncbi:hypothetical protein Tco_0349639 [Tanacetum coccineum]
MHPSSENSPAQASGSQGAVKKVTNNPSLLPPNLGPVADDVALSDNLDVTQEKKQKIKSDFNALLYENNDLRSKYTGACSSYTYISEELNRFKQQAADLGDAAASLQREKESLAYEMGRELGRRESRDLSLTMASGMNRVEPDPTMLEEIKKVEAGLKKESWDCLKEITNAPELSTSVLRFVLRTASGAV